MISPAQRPVRPYSSPLYGGINSKKPDQNASA
jgi:hypothetical protein